MKKTVRLLLALMITATLLSGQAMSVLASQEASSVRISLLGKFDSADTACVKQINTLSKTIQFRNHDTGKNYTLKYDNTSQIYDIHKEPVSASMLEVGQVVDITFLKGSKHLNSLSVSDSAWVEAGVTDFSLVSDDETAKINGTVFHLTRKTLIISDGQAVNPEDILETDTLRVSGIDKEIYSIVVTRGHGYVSLSSDTVNDRSLVGAWIELDKEVIRKITPKMLISAPEGSYNVSIAGNGTKFSSEIVVKRNEETVIDTSVVEVEKVKEGTVKFVVTPEEARIFVDGDEVMNEVAHSYTYGKHKLHVMAEGYKSQDHYLKVAQPDATLFIELEKDKDSSKKEDEDASTESTSADSTESVDSASTASTYEPATSDSASTASSSSMWVTSGTTASTSDSASTSTTAGIDSSAAATTTSASSSTTGSTTGSSAASTTTSGSSGSSTSSSSGSSSGDSGSSGSSSSDDNSLSGYRVSFDAPVGAEAYFDGNYVGIIPCSFAKEAGQHMVTLQKEGYQTKSYTIQVDSEKNNVTYTFPEMVPEKKPSGDSDSGNTGSTSDSGSTGSSSDSGNTGSTSDSGSTGSASDSGNTGSSSDSGNTGSTSSEGTSFSGSERTGMSDAPTPVIGH